MSPALRAYLVYAMTNSRRVDFLRVLEEAPSAAALEKIARMPHNVWETAIWLQVTGRKLVRRADGHFRILPAAEVRPDYARCPTTCGPAAWKSTTTGLPLQAYRRPEQLHDLRSRRSGKNEQPSARPCRHSIRHFTPKTILTGVHSCRQRP